MDVKQDQAAKRLLKKLSALRATLKNDERKLLDQLVTGSADEVEAHTMRTSSANAATNAVHRFAANEVEAHSLNIQSSANAARNTGTNAAANEVEAHSLNVQTANAAKNASRNVAANEVEAHSLNVQSANAARNDSRKVAANEVEAHSMKNDSSRVEGFHIVFDAAKDEYHIA